jgi:hypothetical protein
MLFVSNACINNTGVNKHKILLQDILINNYPEYFFIGDKFTIMGNISSNRNIYTIIYNQHFWGNDRMTGRIVVFRDYIIVGNYGVINEIPEILNNKIIFKGIKNDNINFENGIPETILIDGELYSFEYFNTVQMETKFIGKIIQKDYYGPPNYGENPESDKIERYFVLLLDELIYINFYGENKIIAEMQLILNNIGQINQNENYCVYGIPFSALTGHHHTELVLIVNRADRK